MQGEESKMRTNTIVEGGKGVFSRWGKASFLFSLLPALLLLVGWQSTVGAATVTTDGVEYAPGATATITGSGFGPNDTVTLQVLHIDGLDNDDPSHIPWTVIADGNGNFKT